jgi:hypothetical protein
VSCRCADAWVLALRSQAADRCSIADVPYSLLMLSMFENVKLLLVMGHSRASATALARVHVLSF